jgi:D-inositol-3-phosphate glycosyltransferase
VRIAIAGPVIPYRSGVANHTTQLAATLASRPDCSCRVFSFHRQYPAMLFPGEGDKLDGAAPLTHPQTDYCIDSINPLTWKSCAHRIRAWKTDLLIVPAWTFFLAPCLGLIARECRKTGIRIIQIVHNVADHESSAVKWSVNRFQLAQSDAYVTHNSNLARELESRFPNIPTAVHPHPIFENYPLLSQTPEPRAPLELLFFGLIRRYKGLDIALKALAELTKDFRLSVVGECWDGQAEIEEQISKLGLEEKVEFVPRYVSDLEAAHYFSRADAVILPYREVSGSGVVPVAYHYGKPVIVSRLPGLEDVVRQDQTGWLVPPEDPAALRELIENRVSRESARSMLPAIERLKQDMSWEGFARAVLELSERL